MCASELSKVGRGVIDSGEGLARWQGGDALLAASSDFLGWNELLDAVYVSYVVFEC